MPRLRFKIPSWEEGRKQAELVAKKFDLQLEERDETIVAHGGNEDEFKISFFLDPREFTFVTIKADEQRLIELKNYFRQFIEK